MAIIKKLKLDTNINIGNIISAIGLIIAMISAYNGIASRMDKMEVKVDAMWKAFKIQVVEPAK